MRKIVLVETPGSNIQEAYNSLMSQFDRDLYYEVEAFKDDTTMAAFMKKAGASKPKALDLFVTYFKREGRQTLSNRRFYSETMRKELAKRRIYFGKELAEYERSRRKKEEQENQALGSQKVQQEGKAAAEASPANEGAKKTEAPKEAAPAKEATPAKEAPKQAAADKAEPVASKTEAPAATEAGKEGEDDAKKKAEEKAEKLKQKKIELKRISKKLEKLPPDLQARYKIAPPILLDLPTEVLRRLSKVSWYETAEKMKIKRLPKEEQEAKLKQLKQVMIQRKLKSQRQQKRINFLFRRTKSWIRRPYKDISTIVSSFISDLPAPHRRDEIHFLVPEYENAVVDILQIAIEKKSVELLAVAEMLCGVVKPRLSSKMREEYNQFKLFISTDLNLVRRYQNAFRKIPMYIDLSFIRAHLTDAPRQQSANITTLPYAFYNLMNHIRVENEVKYEESKPRLNF